MPDPLAPTVTELRDALVRFRQGLATAVETFERDVAAVLTKLDVFVAADAPPTNGERST